MAYQGYEGYGSPNLSARERAALALLNRQRKGISTIGEGIYSAVSDITDAQMLKRMEKEESERRARSEAAFQEYGRATAPAAPLAPARPAAAEEPTFAPATRSAAAATPVDDGGYNLIDAQAGMGMPGALRAGVFDAIQQQPTSPDMQAYLARQSGREGPKGTQDSPTGAAGPFQFTRGTGAQYGLMGPGGDIRDDPGASTTAARRLTEDNAAVFRRINGRDPTMADLAVMHQQGGGTGARMIAGTGNAPAQNLAVNNIAPGSSPQQAVAAIKGFYGMPERPIDPRDQVAQTMMSARSRGAPDPALAAAYNRTTDQAVPPVDPTMPAAQPPVATPPAPLTTPAAGPGGPPLLNQQVAQASQAALPPGQGIRLAPPPQALQPPPRAEPGRPPEARMQPPSREEIAAQRYMSHPDAALATRANADFTRLYNERKAQFASDLIESRAAQQRWDERQANAPKLAAEAQKSQLDLAKGQREAREAEQFQGIPATIVHKDMNDSAVKARAAAGAIRASQVAMAAFNSPEGVFSGAGADWKLKGAKAATAAGIADYSKQIKNTEVFQGSMQPIVASILHETSGSSGLTENELAFARAAAAGDINLDAESVKELMRIIQKRSEFQVGQHQAKMDELFPDNPKAKAMYGVEMPKAEAKEESPAATRPSGAIVDVASEADVHNLPRNTRFRLPNGRTGTVR